MTSLISKAKKNRIMKKSKEDRCQQADILFFNTLMWFFYQDNIQRHESIHAGKDSDIIV